MFCGILPWTWFSASLNESAGVLISGGNLIKKVLFPAEILPIVTRAGEHGPLLLRAADPGGVPDLLPAAAAAVGELVWFPVVVLVQLVLTLGFALMLSALTVHFRDIRDILSNLLTFWFFATPIIYCPDERRARRWASRLLNAEPVHASGDLVSGNPVLRRAASATGVAAAARRALDCLVPFALFRVRPAARYVCGGSHRVRRRRRQAEAGSCPMNAIEVTHASKIYRRYNRRRQFATLKSALLSRSLVRDLEPDETFTAVAGRVLHRADRPDARRDRAQRLRARAPSSSWSPASPSRRPAR